MIPESWTPLSPQLSPMAGHVDLKPDPWSSRGCYAGIMWDCKVRKLSEFPGWGNMPINFRDSLNQLIFIVHHVIGTVPDIWDMGANKCKGVLPYFL